MPQLSKWKGKDSIEFSESVRKGEVDFESFYRELFIELKRINKKYGVFVTLASPEGLDAPGRGRIAGVPVSVKDNICTKGMRTTAGSRILEDYVPVFDAAVVSSVRKEGGVVVGKTSMDEFGFGTFSTNSAYSVPRNPWDESRCCGGSSGGAAALVSALDYPHIAIGQSTGGSISAPASFCGVVGLTPTYGRVSRFGLIDYANSLDKIGPIAKTVREAALMLSVIAGKDERDFTTEGKREDFTKYIAKDIKGVRIAVPKEYFGDGIDEGVKKRIWDAIGTLESHGAKWEEVSLPSTELGIATYYIIATSEASTNLARYCGMRYGAEGEIKGDFNEYFSEIRTKYFGKEAKRRILLGTFSRMSGYRDQYYMKALKIRTLIIREFRKVFRTHDVLISPTMPVIAPKFSEIEGMSPLEVYMMDTLTVPQNLAGMPSVSVPCGLHKGMPVGMHVIGNHFQEGKVIRVSDFWERVSGFPRTK